MHTVLLKCMLFSRCVILTYKKVRLIIFLFSKYVLIMNKSDIKRFLQSFMNEWLTGLFCKILFSKSYEDILYKRCMKTIECSLSIFIVPISNIILIFVCKIFCSRHCSFCNELLSICNTITSYFVNCKKTCLHVFV